MQQAIYQLTLSNNTTMGIFDQIKERATGAYAYLTGQKNEDVRLYSDHLESLIDMALSDGVLTDKEKQVLYKKAQEECIDLDEFEMVLNARLYKRQNKSKTSQSGATRSSSPLSNQDSQPHTKYGNVKKCPACGSVIESFSLRCPDCGYEFRNVEANASITQLFKLLSDVDAGNSNAVIDFLQHSPAGKLLFGSNKRTWQKQQIIANYPIPTTKEDIVEFLTMAFPLAKKAGNFFSQNSPANSEHNKLVPAWKAKLEQIIIKARFSMKGDPSTLEQIERYAQELNIK